MMRGKVTTDILLTRLIYLGLAYFAFDFYDQGKLLPAHQKYAQEISDGHYFYVPHGGIYWVNALIHHLTGVGVQVSLSYLLSVHVALALCAILWVLRLWITKPIDTKVRLLLGLLVLFAAPVGLPVFNEIVYNFGHRNTFHLRNASHTGGLPYFIFAFGFLSTLIGGHLREQHFSCKKLFATGALFFISAMIKPSFAVSMMPAVCLYCWQRLKMRVKDYAQIICAFMPTALLILAEFYIGFVDKESVGIKWSISFNPLYTWSGNNLYPPVAFVLALAFPLMIAFYRRKQLAFYSVIAWINLVIALIPYVLLQTDGSDFVWSYLDARTILFLCSAVEWWKWFRESCENENATVPFQFHAVHCAGLLFFAHAMFGYVAALLRSAGRI